MTRNKSH